MTKAGGIPLGGRIGLLLVAAVLPLAVLGALYAWAAGETAREADMRARYETSRVVAGTVESVVEGAARATDMILAANRIADEVARCEEMGRRLLTIVPGITDVQVLVGGNRLCGIRRQGDGFAPLAGAPPTISGGSDAAVALGADGQPALRIIRTGAGAAGPIAVVHVGLQPVWNRVTTSIAGLEGSRVFVLTETGGVIAEPAGVVDTTDITAVIAAVADAGDGGLPVVQVDAPGVGFVAIARVGTSGLRVAVVSRGGVGNRSVLARAALVAGLPFLFLVVAVAIAWLGVDRLVNRWLRRLARATRSYGEGDLGARVGPMPRAPEEFRALAESFDAMAANVEARSRDLENALAEKNHFVRELHHRVKNNFQMIASLLTLQRREADRTTELAIREAHDRVQALAAAYRASYADGETGSVPVGPLVVDLVERLRESARLSSRVVAIDVGPDAISMHLDRAIPFALLLTELVVPLLEQVSGEEEMLRLTMRWLDGDRQTIAARLELAAGTTAPGRPLSDRLSRAYAAQLGATVTRHGQSIDISLPRAQT